MQKDSTSFGSQFSQIAWVVADILALEKFFRKVFGISYFVKMENLHSQELEGRYFGKVDNHVFHLYLAYSGESIFQEFLNKHPIVRHALSDTNSLDIIN